MRYKLSRHNVALIIAACAMNFPGQIARSHTAGDFYRGKTIRVMIGSAPGAVYDLTGRLLSRYMGRHIPGAPSIVVENRPGASSLLMTNYLYNNAPRDGTAIGMPASGIMLEPRLHLLTREGGVARFDVSRLIWIGTPVQDPEVLWVYGTTPVKTFADLKRTSIVVGATATGADNYTLPLIANEVLGTHMKIVPGYQGQGNIFVAAERGEIQGNTTGLPNLTTAKADWIKEHRVSILVQFGTRRIDSLPNVPTAAELAATEDARKMLLLYALKFNMARPLVVPPDVPPDRVVALRAGFEATMQDPQFLAEARHLGFDIKPIGGSEIDKYMKAIAAAPQGIVERLRKLISP